MAKLSEIIRLGEVTADDLFIITDDETGKTRTVKWEDIEKSIAIENVNGVISTYAIDCGVYAGDAEPQDPTSFVLSGGAIDQGVYAE